MKYRYMLVNFDIGLSVIADIIASTAVGIKNSVF